MSVMSIAAPRASGTKQNLIQGTILGIILTTLSYFVGIEAHWIHSLNWLEVFAVFTSYVCTYLCVTERRINYPIGAVSTAAYAILFFHSHLLGSALLNAYLTPQLIYGWIRWKKDAVTRPITRVALKWWPVYLAISVGAYIGAVHILAAFGGTLALLDSIVLVASILAQWLLDNKKIENWAVWMIVNAVAIVDYYRAGLPLAAFQYVFFLMNTFWGLYVWNTSRKVIATEPAQAPEVQNDSVCVVDGNAADQRTLAPNPVC